MAERKFEIEKIAWEKGYYVNGLGEAYSPKGTKLKLKIHNGWYYAFNIKHLGKSRRVNVHRLQAYQKFKDKIYEQNMVIRHLNGNSFDNTFNNIGIGTPHDNSMDIPKEVRQRSAINASTATIKYPMELVQEIKEFYNQCKSYKLTKRKYNISSSGTLWKLLNDRKI